MCLSRVLNSFRAPLTASSGHSYGSVEGRQQNDGLEMEALSHKPASPSPSSSSQSLFQKPTCLPKATRYCGTFAFAGLATAVFATTIFGGLELSNLIMPGGDPDLNKSSAVTHGNQICYNHTSHPMQVDCFSIIQQSRLTSCMVVVFFLGAGLTVFLGYLAKRSYSSQQPANTSI